jgi:hypothetical protein
MPAKGIRAFIFSRRQLVIKGLGGQEAARGDLFLAGRMNINTSCRAINGLYALYSL